ncbi:MAG: Rid family detoxifying hydrolase [Caldiserica bacterium]|jgi:2-iminobutanoate/2-iminopropanoate deaminase|nr:Rid family detoxifying hydrolase [Caldisericota bacterium]MDH7562862.1 Rid family detoxifying hydrolase [Caldisericota bacterium]
MEIKPHSGKVKPLGPYSQILEVGDFLFLSGQVALARDGNVISGDTQTQAEKILENIYDLLESAGSSLSRVIKTTIFLTDLKDFQGVNEVFRRNFKEPFPARTTVQVSALPLGAKIEIEAIALKGK